jgi:hypothetical protein
MSQESADDLIVLNRFVQLGNAALGARRAQAAEDMLPGERYAARFPGSKDSPGYVTRKADSNEAYLRDEAMLMAHLQDGSPDDLEDVDRIRPELEAAAIAVLKEHLPEAVESYVRIKPTILTGLLRAATREPGKAPPGIGFKTVPGTVAVYADKAKQTELDEAIQAGAFPLHKILRQIGGASNGDQDA